MAKNSHISLADLKRRVTSLERQVAELVAQRDRGERPKDWRDAIGALTGNDGLKEVFEEARKLREADRARARLYWAERDRRAARAKRPKVKKWTSARNAVLR